MRGIADRSLVPSCSLFPFTAVIWPPTASEVQLHQHLLSPNTLKMASQFHPLQPIGENIHFFQPPPTPEVTNCPALITLCTWLGGATPQRIQKYISGYRALYPTSAILLITTRIQEISVLPFNVLHARLAPARNVIRRFVNEDSTTGPNILFHLFSHGGCNTAIQLALSLHTDSTPIEIGNHVRGIIFDCCPGDTSFERSYQAATHSLPRSAPAQAVGKALLYPVVGVILGLQQVGLTSSVQHLRAQLNDPRVFGATAARLYLYSTADQVVGWEDVESHLKAAKSVLECKVEGVAFSDSPHCAIVRDHPGRYWGEIKRFWMEMESIEAPVRSRL